jgi:hypothetical protein
MKTSDRNKDRPVAAMRMKIGCATVLHGENSQRATKNTSTGSEIEKDSKNKRQHKGKTEGHKRDEKLIFLFKSDKIHTKHRGYHPLSLI